MEYEGCEDPETSKTTPITAITLNTIINLDSKLIWSRLIIGSCKFQVCIIHLKEKPPSIFKISVAFKPTRLLISLNIYLRHFALAFGQISNDKGTADQMCDAQGPLTTIADCQTLQAIPITTRRVFVVSNLSQHRAVVHWMLYQLEISGEKGLCEGEMKHFSQFFPAS